MANKDEDAKTAPEVDVTDVVETEPVETEPVGEGAEAPEEETTEETGHAEKINKLAPAETSDERYIKQPKVSKNKAAADYPLNDSDKERGFVRPFRSAVVHVPSGRHLTLGDAVAEELATDPSSVKKLTIVPVGTRPVKEFIWEADETKVGS